MTRLAVTWHAAHRYRQLLVAAPPQTSLHELFGAAGRLFVNGRPVPAEATLATAGVRDGAIVGPEPVPPPVPVAPPGSLALLVASGAAAGASCAVPASGTVGRSIPLELGDTEMSGRHLHIHSAGGQVTVADAGSTNGTVVAGERLPGDGRAREVAPGDLIWAGRTALTVVRAPDRDAALTGTPDGKLRYSRSPRLIERPRPPRVVLPEPPPEPQKLSFPVLAIVLPVLVGVAMTVFMHQLAYLAFVALSPLMMIGNALTERHRGKRGYRQRVADFTQRHEQAQADLAAGRRAELGYRRDVHPDPASLLLIATAPSRRLWERQPADDDFLALRLGTGVVRWSTGDQGGEMSLPDAPVALVLPDCGAAGLTGRPADTRALARAMLLSAAVLHSPREVTITVLTVPDTEADWDWLRWLPHARQPDSHPGLVRIGNDGESIRQRLAELTALLESRRPGTYAGSRAARPETSDLVVLDGSYRLRMSFDLAALLREGPSAGLYFLCLDETAAQLPPECRQAVVRLTDDDGAVGATLLRPGKEHDGITADVVSPAVCESAARAMAPITDVGGLTAAGSLPSSVRFLDVAALEPPDPRPIQARWAAGGRTTQALIGVRADGAFALDLAQGPHLLVAGTTGSGKSELLQTLVASLAVANRPDAMNFVLIDYKGGAAFRAFQTLPHTVGMLSDLDEFLVERALVSLRAELQRRKAILNQADKTNIQRYWDALPGRPGSDPLPRLVIVVDEFAVMADKLPEQLASLIDIGRQGRSLGIHLVLATQRPAGVVTADLRSNINLRIALRVASPEDSRDVIDTVDAARIPAEGCAGRAYAWTGEGRPVAFQSARVGGRRPGARQAQAPVAVPLPWADLGQPQPGAGRDEVGPADLSGEELTDLSVLVEAIRAAARDGVSRQRSPWSPPLPPALVASDLARRWPADQDRLRLSYGLLDRPHEQRQVPAVFDIAGGGHLLIAGAPQSGRSTVLRTLAGGLAAQVNPDDVHLYVLDGGGALAALSVLPHCGAVVTAAEPDRVERLLGRLTAELGTRTQMLAAGGYGDLAEYRAAQPASSQPPFLMILVDRYDAFLTALEHIDGGRLLGELQRLIRDGLASGIRVVLTGDRTMLTGRLGSLVEHKLVLRMADKTDFALAGLHSRAIPRDMPNGRGFQLPAGDLVQVASLSPHSQGAAENHALRDLARRVPPGASRPFRVDPLPSSISMTEALGLSGHGSGPFVGVGGDELTQIRVETPGLLVIGPHGSGRSTALAVQAASLARSGTPLVLVTPRRSTLAGRLEPLLLHLTGSDADAAARLTAALDGTPGAAIVVDDAELLADTPLGNELAAWYRRIRDTGHRLLAAAAADGSFGLRGLVPELAKTKCGLVLEPASTTDGSVFGARLPASVFAPGVLLRGALIHHGRITAVQVPTWSDDPAGRP
jgi:S-DNA-T family DNA segregation ATPase FtsK/SpoIIIE